MLADLAALHGLAVEDVIEHFCHKSSRPWSEIKPHTRGAASAGRRSTSWLAGSCTERVWWQQAWGHHVFALRITRRSALALRPAVFSTAMTEVIAKSRRSHYDSH